MMNDSSDKELAERLTELEIRYSHQEQLLEELNDVLTESHGRIDRLEQEVYRFREMLARLAPTLEESPDE